MDAEKATSYDRVVSLREYVDTMFASRDIMLASVVTTQKEHLVLMREAAIIRLDSLRHEIEASIDAQKEAVSKAEESIEKRLSGMNEFRSALGDQAKTMLTRIEYDQAHQALVDRVDTAVATWTREHSALVNRHQEDIQAIRVEMARQPEVRALERAQFLTRGEQTGAVTERTEHRAITASQIAMVAVGLTVVWIIIAVVSIVIGAHGVK